MRVKVTRNYQITIPAEVRKAMRIRLGDVLDVSYDEERGVAVLRKVGAARTTLRCGRKLTPEEIEELIELSLKESLR